MRLPKHDPGPCPVDDCPHTTCTSDDYDPKTGRAVVRRVAAAARRTAATAQCAAHRRARAGETEFTTATYRKEKHDPRRARAVKDKP